MTDTERRKLWQAYFARREARSEAWAKSGYTYPPPHPEPLRAELRDMSCGAKTRAGTPCKRKDLYNNGRCKLHGGMSTGPRTAAGKAISALNGRRPKQAKVMRGLRDR